MKNTLATALLLVALALPTISSAQKKAPLPDVEIQLVNADGRVVQRQSTSEKGSWSFVDLPPGEYSLDIAAKEIEEAALLVPAIQKVRESASRSRSGVNVAAGDVTGDGHPVMEEMSLNFTKIEYGHFESKRQNDARDRSSGQATGKRTHKPVVFVKEFDRSSSPLITITKAGGSVSGTVHGTYDVKTLKK